MGCRGLPGCSIIRVSLPSQISAFCALAARSPCICSRLQVALGLRPKCPQGTRFLPARLRVALRCAQQPTGLTLPFGALMVSLPSQISAFCALTARSPCICSRLQVALGLRPKCPQGTRFLPARLRVALRCAQQPTGLTLPSGALRVALGLWPKCPQGTRFPPVPQALCRSTKSERCECPKGTRNAPRSTPP